MKAEIVAIPRIGADPNNPRKELPSDFIETLTRSILANGIKVALIGFLDSDRIILLDGHCRLEAAIAAQLTEVPMIVFPKRPSEAEVLESQLTINAHRRSLNPVDEYEAFVRLANLKKWSATELATGLAVSNAEVTRVLSIGKLSDEEKQLVRSGKISKSSAYAITRTNGDDRAALVQKAAAGELTRDQLNEKVRRKEKMPSTARRVCCQVPNGSVTVSAAKGLNISSLIELLEELVRSCRKARTEGFDISTALRVFRDRCRAPQTA